MPASVSVPVPALTSPPVPSMVPAKLVGSPCRRSADWPPSWIVDAGDAAQILDRLRCPSVPRCRRSRRLPVRLSAARARDAAVARQVERAVGVDRGRAGIGVDAAQVLAERRRRMTSAPPVPPPMPPSWITPLNARMPLVMVSVWPPRLTMPLPRRPNSPATEAPDVVCEMSSVAPPAPPARTDDARSWRSSRCPSAPGWRPGRSACRWCSC